MWYGSGNLIFEGSLEEENISRWIEMDEKVLFKYIDFINDVSSNELGFYEVMAFEDRLVQMYVHSITTGGFNNVIPLDDLANESAIQKIARVQTGTLESCITSD